MQITIDPTEGGLLFKGQKGLLGTFPRGLFKGPTLFFHMLIDDALGTNELTHLPMVLDMRESFVDSVPL